MKKITLTFIFVFVFALTALAEGDIHTGGRTCPTGQQTCLVESPAEPLPADDTIISVIFELWESVF